MNYGYYTNFANVNIERLFLSIETFSQKEKDRVYSFRNQTDQVLVGGGRLLLLYALNQLNTTKSTTLPTLEFNPYGKPSVCNSNIEFNISHSGTMAVCFCVIDGSIGVDIEQLAHIELCEYNTIFTPAEYEILMVGNKFDFFRMWTIKEAVMKAIGKGFSMNPQLIDTINLKKTNKLTLGHCDWFIHSQILDDYTLSVASSRQDVPLIKEVNADDLLAMF